jgi:glyoxylase-like metal-dependent hydrolase (beta-lactamase superfamily II)
MDQTTPYDHLHAIEVPTPFPVGPITVYLADAPNEPLTLIDTGPLTREAREALETGLEWLGHRVSDLERILVTHAHADHYGLASGLAKASGAEVWTHPWNLQALTGHHTDREQRVAFYAKLFRLAAVPEEVASVVGRVTEGMGRYAEAVDVVRGVDQGDSLCLADHEWHVLHLPGHAAGLVCLYEPESSVLLSSDHLLAEISSNPVVEPPPPGQSIRLHSLVAYRISLERVAGMGIKQALPSHGPAIHYVADLVRRRLAFHGRRLESVLMALETGTQTTWEVTEKLFPDRTPLDSFLALSECLGHLELLELEGRVVASNKGQEVFWTLATGANVPWGQPG